MSLKVIGHKDSLVEEAGKLALAASSPEACAVIFPGKRPGHFLRRWLAEKKGGALRSPLITSMDGFMDLLAADLGVKGTQPSALDLAAILHGRLKKELCGIISRDPADLPLDAFLPWALKLAGDFEELKIELKTPKQLAAYDSILPEELRTGRFIKKLQSVSALYAGFYAELEREGLLTRSMKYAAAAEKIGGWEKKYERIIFAGFYALTASERAVVKQLAGAGAHVLLEPGPGLEEQFKFLGRVEQPPVTGRPALKFYKAPDTHGEVFALARALKAPSPDDVVVLPEAQALFPLLEHALPGAEYNVSMGYPLAATPVYALLDALGDLLDKRCPAGYFAPDYLKFVFHPYVKNLSLGGAAEPSRVAFQAVGEALAERVNKYVPLAELENDEEIAGGAAEKLAEYGAAVTAADIRAHLRGAHDALIRPFEEIKDIADFASKLLAFISHISECSTAPLHPYWAPFAEKAIESVIELRSCRLAGERFASPAGYFKFLKTFMQGAAYPFPGTPLKGLQVLGFLETRGLKFRRVFFLDANAGVLPGAGKEDTVLPHAVRAGLGLSTYKTREALARYHFSALVSGASEAHIFYKDAADKERSPFVEQLAWERERRGEGTDSEEVHLRVSFSQGEPAAVRKTAELARSLRGRTYSPSALNAYLACGLRFYYRYGLRLSEAGELGDDIDQRDIGLIVHEALENFFRAKTGRPLVITEADYGLALAEARKVFDLKLRGHAAGYEYLIKRQVERRLKDILDYHRDSLSGVTILGCETELETVLETRFGPVKLKGQADRVDDRGGVIHVVDYKTGSSAAVPDWQKFGLEARADWPSTLASVQLPFYALAYMEANGLNPEGMDASLMLLGGEKITEESLYWESRGKAPAKAEVFGRYRAAIQVLLEEILDPDLPFNPAPDEKSCAGCEFRLLCGRQWVE